MNVWFCTACGTPSGSLAERCLHCGAPRPGAQEPPPTPPLSGPPMSGPPATGPVPLAQYEVFAPPAQPEGYAPQPEGYAPQPEARTDPQAGYDPGFAGYQQQPAYEPQPPYQQPPPGFGPGEGYGQPGQQYAQPEQQYAQPGPPAGARRRWWVPVLLVLVLLLAGGAIATVLLVDDEGEQTADPRPAPTTGAPSASRAPSRPSASASPSGPPRLVTTDASVTDARATGVAALFEDYFTAINNRDYDRALSAYDPAGVIDPNDARQAADFKNGIGTTTDSGIVLRSVGPPASGRGVLDARLTFRSNQQPGYGPKERPTETCTAWDVTYALSQPAGTYYRILVGKATHAPC